MAKILKIRLSAGGQMKRVCWRISDLLAEVNTWSVRVPAALFR